MSKQKRKRGHVTEVFLKPGAKATDVANADRDWFASHPGVQKRLRPYIPGELADHPLPDGMHEGDITSVYVIRIDDEHNARIPLTEARAQGALKHPPKLW